MSSNIAILDNIVIVLVEPLQSGNVGMVVRALMNTGFTRLRIVNPHHYDPKIVSAAAHRSEAFQETIEFYDDVPSALHDVNLVVSASNRQRELGPPLMPPDEMAPIVLEHAKIGTAAILFGREDWGLPNEIVHRSHYQLYIPVDPAYASLNLAQAVLLTTYELRRAVLKPRDDLPEVGIDPRDPPATEAEFTAAMDSILEALGKAGFFKPGQEPAKRLKFDRLFRRTRPTASEAGLLRAMGFVLERELSCSKYAQRWEERKRKMQEDEQSRKANRRPEPPHMKIF
jgi:tRNA/rRNA methyltransferase